MSITPQGRRLMRLLSSALAGATAALMLPAAAPAAPSPPADASPTAKAEAIVKPSIVYVASHWTGWVRLPDGSLLSTSATTADLTCTGFVVGSGGYIMTAGHCVDDQTMTGAKLYILQAVITDLVQQGYIAQPDAALALQGAKENWKVEGTTAGSPPDRTISVYQTVAASAVSMVEPMQATVVDFQPMTAGDVALLKVQPPSAMPVVQVASTAPDVGTDIVAAGYPGSVSAVVDPKLEPSFKDGRISSLQTEQGVPFTEISAAISHGMSGGPTVDNQGRVVGVVSHLITTESQPFNFITSTTMMQATLARNGVHNTLSSSDVAYRAGITAYFADHYHDAVKQFDKVLAVSPNHQLAQVYRARSVALYSSDPQGKPLGLILVVAGAVVVLLAVALIAVLLLLRRRRGRAAPAPAAGPAPPAVPAPAAAPASPAVPAPPVAPGWPASYGEAVPVSPPPAVTSAAPEPTESLAAPAIYCPNCGELHAAEAHYCATCGQPFDTWLPGQASAAR